MTDLFNLEGQGALVTGGNGGIGLGMAKALAGAGADVAIWGTNAEKNERALAELADLNAGGKAAAIVCDVADEDSVAKAMAETVAEIGRVDSCFANAGTGAAPGSFDKLALEEWRRVAQVNLDGVFLTLRAAATQMIEQGDGGSLVATSSLTAIEGAPRSSHYAAAKGALIPLIRTLAVELARKGIRANAIMPGWIDTDLTHQMFEDERFSGAVMPRIPARRWGTPADIGPAAVYLASRASNYHTGDVLKIDGAYSIC
ncbi:MAG TPA: SDR family NAD(P)-dependent oxidoreductase [Solirubrobacterales bacterium]|nr:SDR family NAD(P)-dependent oxidoreductase [Solirubrobacterales bacterium]